MTTSPNPRYSIPQPWHGEFYGDRWLDDEFIEAMLRRHWGWLSEALPELDLPIKIGHIHYTAATIQAMEAAWATLAEAPPSRIASASKRNLAYQLWQLRQHWKENHGNYTFLKLKPETPNSEIHRINEEIIALGYPREVFNGVVYGPFVTEDQIIEDCRYMNEDPEGLKQAQGWQRPITPARLESNWMFLRRRQFCSKLGYKMENTAIVLRWAAENTDLIDEESSSHWTTEQIEPLCPSLAKMIED